MKFIPSIIAKNKDELLARFSKVKSASKVFHLDVMDGKFVSNKSLMFDFDLPKNKKYEIHLMVKDPYKWIKRNWKKGDLFLIHPETLSRDFLKIRDFLAKKKKKIGVVVSPKIQVSEIGDFLLFTDRVTIMTVTPGKYGAKFLKRSFAKIERIRNLDDSLKIQLDGGINEKTIKLIPKYVDSVVLGSYLQNSLYPKEAIKLLKKRMQ